MLDLFTYNLLLQNFMDKTSSNKQSQNSLESYHVKHLKYENMIMTQFNHVQLKNILRQACFGFKLEKDNLFQRSQNLFDLKKFVKLEYSNEQLLSQFESTIDSQLYQDLNITFQQDGFNNKLDKYIKPFKNYLQYFNQNHYSSRSQLQQKIQAQSKQYQVIIEKLKKLNLKYAESFINDFQDLIEKNNFLGFLKELEMNKGILKTNSIQFLQKILFQKPILKNYLERTQKNKLTEFYTFVISLIKAKLSDGKFQSKEKEDKHQQKRIQDLNNPRMKVQLKIQLYYSKLQLYEIPDINSLFQDKVIIFLQKFNKFRGYQNDEILHAFIAPNQNCENQIRREGRCGCYIQYLLSQNIFIDSVRTQKISSLSEFSGNIKNSIEATTSLQIPQNLLLKLKSQLEYNLSQGKKQTKTIKKSLIKLVCGYITLKKKLFKKLLADQVIKYYNEMTQNNYKNLQKLTKSFLESYGQFIPIKVDVGIYYIQYQHINQKGSFQNKGLKVNANLNVTPAQLQVGLDKMNNLLNEKNQKNFSRINISNPQIISRQRYKLTIEYISQNIQQILNESKLMTALGDKYYYLCAQYQNQNMEIINFNYEEGQLYEILLNRINKTKIQFQKWANQKFPNIFHRLQTNFTESFILQFNELYFQSLRYMADQDIQIQIVKYKTKMKLFAILALKLCQQKRDKKFSETLIRFLEMLTVQHNKIQKNIGYLRQKKQEIDNIYGGKIHRILEGLGIYQLKNSIPKLQDQQKYKFLYQDQDKVKNYTTYMIQNMFLLFDSTKNQDKVNNKVDINKIIFQRKRNQVCTLYFEWVDRNQKFKKIEYFIKNNKLDQNADGQNVLLVMYEFLNQLKQFKLSLQKNNTNCPKYMQITNHLIVQTKKQLDKQKIHTKTTIKKIQKLNIVQQPKDILNSQQIKDIKEKIIRQSINYNKLFTQKKQKQNYYYQSYNQQKYQENRPNIFQHQRNQLRQRINQCKRLYQNLSKDLELYTMQTKNFQSVINEYLARILQIIPVQKSRQIENQKTKSTSHSKHFYLDFYEQYFVKLLSPQQFEQFKHQKSDFIHVLQNLVRSIEISQDKLQKVKQDMYRCQLQIKHIEQNMAYQVRHLQKLIASQQKKPRQQIQRPNQQLKNKMEKYIQQLLKPKKYDQTELELTKIKLYYKLLVLLKSSIQFKSLSDKKFSAFNFLSFNIYKNKLYSVRFKHLTSFVDPNGVHYLKGTLISKNKQLSCRLKIYNRLGFNPHQNKKIKIELQQIELNPADSATYLYLNYIEYSAMKASQLRIGYFPEKKALFYLIQSDDQVKEVIKT